MVGFEELSFMRDIIFSNSLLSFSQLSIVSCLSSSLSKSSSTFAYSIAFSK